MSPPNPAILSPNIPLISAEFAITRSVLRGTRFGVLPLARFPHTASNFVGGGRNDGAVVIGVCIRCARDGGEKGIRRIAVPAGSRAHGAGVGAPWTDRANARVPVFVIACRAVRVPEIGVIAREGLLDRVLTHDGVGVAEDVGDVVAGPLADGVGFEDCAAIFCRVGLFADADLAVPGSELQAAFCGAVAAGHYSAVAVGFVEGDFVAGPVDYAVRGGCFG